MQPVTREDCRQRLTPLTTPREIGCAVGIGDVDGGVKNLSHTRFLVVH